MNTTLVYVNCSECGLIVDVETEACELRRKQYCINCYDKLVQEEQEKEISKNEYKH